MTELITIKISDLKENNAFSELVPEMTTQEYDDLVNSIRKQGVRQPIHILSDKTVLDGRHRVRACKEIGIKEIQALSHELKEDEAIRFVTDTAVERRNLSKEQKVDIIFQSESLIKEIEGEAKRGQGNRRDLTSVSTETEVAKSRTSERIAEMAGASRATVTRMKKVKTEDPDLYDKIVTGEESPSGAYYKLPSVQQPKPKPTQEPKPIAKSLPKKEPKLSLIKNTSTMSKEEIAMKIAIANLEFNGKQMIDYVADNKDNLYDAILDTAKRDSDFIVDLNEAIELLNTMLRAYLGGEKNEKAFKQ